MADNDWMWALGPAAGLFGMAKGQAEKQRAKYEENRRKALEAYQQEMAGLGAGLETAYAPTSAEQGNVLRRYGIAGQPYGARDLYTELDPEVSSLYRERALEELRQPDIRYKESVNDILGRIEEEAASGAVGRGVYGSGLHAQDYSGRALRELVPFRMQAITNALNRGDQLAKTLETMRAQAVGEYEPVRQREVTGKQLGAQYRAQGAGAKYGTEAEIAAGRAQGYSERLQALGELLGKIPSAAATAAGYPEVGAAMGGFSPMPSGGGTRTYSSGRYPWDEQLPTPDFYSYAPISSEDYYQQAARARRESAREARPYGY